MKLINEEGGRLQQASQISNIRHRMHLSLFLSLSLTGKERGNCSFVCVIAALYPLKNHIESAEHSEGHMTDECKV
jgi:hypothetical protein